MREGLRYRAAIRWHPGWQWHGWLIDFDRGVIRIPATAWRERNLKRLLRSLIKLRGERSVEDVQKDYARLRRAYDMAWNRGT